MYNKALGDEKKL